jgi:hypothetical protein
MNPITVQITRTSKPYILCITGLHPVYGFSGDFLSVSGATSMRNYTAEISAEGFYKVPARKDGGAQVVIGTRRIDTGYVHVSADGVVTEITPCKVQIAAAAENN